MIRREGSPECAKQARSGDGRLKNKTILQTYEPIYYPS